MAWALAAKLARGGEIGTIWAISRPIVYHGLDRLERAGLIRATGLERGGRGPHRVVYAATPEGREELAAWLLPRSQHVRDIRSLFLLKVVLSERAGIDVEPLLVAQRTALLPLLGWLEAQLDDAGTEAPGETTVARVQARDRRRGRPFHRRHARPLERKEAAPLRLTGRSGSRARGFPAARDRSSVGGRAQ